MVEKMLVRDQFHNPDGTTGKCPHCGKSVNAYRTVKACEHCRKPVAWEWNELSVQEMKDEEERRSKESEKGKEEIPIKPCPFCGGKASVKTSSHGVDGAGLFYQLHSVECVKCGATTGKTYRTEFRRDAGQFKVVNDGYAEAVSAWNRRA